MSGSTRRVGWLVAILVSALPATAAADWLIVPFLGTAVGGETTFVDLDRGVGQNKATFGGSVALLSDRFLGIEADVGHSPGFFQSDDPEGVVISSRVTTVSGNVILATPLSVTQESLRPYLTAGLGLMQARTRTAGDVLPDDLGVVQDVLGLSVGGGGIGVLGERTGVRFDVRRIKAVTGEDGPFARPGISRLSLWRATLGVVIRY